MEQELHLNECDLKVIQWEIEKVLRRSSYPLIKNYLDIQHISSRLDVIRDRLVKSGVIPETIIFDVNHFRELKYLADVVMDLTEDYERTQVVSLVPGLSHYNRRLAETREKIKHLSTEMPVVNFKVLPEYLLPKILCYINEGITPTEYH